MDEDDFFASLRGERNVFDTQDATRQKHERLADIVFRGNRLPAANAAKPDAMRREFIKEGAIIEPCKAVSDNATKDVTKYFDDSVADNSPLSIDDWIPFYEAVAHIADEPVSNIDFDSRGEVQIMKFIKRQEETDRDFEERKDKLNHILRIIEPAIYRGDVKALLHEKGLPPIPYLDHRFTLIEITSLKTWLESMGMFPSYFFGVQEMKETTTGKYPVLLDIAISVVNRYFNNNTFNQNDRATHPKKEQVFDWIKEKYAPRKFSENQLQSIWTVATTGLIGTGRHPEKYDYRARPKP
jgi:hypothetical protein